MITYTYIKIIYNSLAVVLSGHQFFLNGTIQITRKWNVSANGLYTILLTNDTGI